MRNRFHKAVFFVAVVFCAFSAIRAQEQPVLKQNTKPYSDDAITLSINSRLMGRELPYRIILPARYKVNTGIRYPAIYLLHGLYGHFDNWTEKTKLSEYSTLYQFILIMPEGNDGWWTDSATVPNDRYESYIVKELIPEIDKKFRTITDRDHRFIAGLSMGGYGAVKFGLKYSDMFSLVGSFSGAFDATRRTEKTGNKYPSIPIVYGPEGSKTRTDNDIFALIRSVPDDKIASLPFIYFDCGTEDPFVAVNREFAALLAEKKVPHEFRELPGKHEWPYWDQQVQEFLTVANRRLKSATKTASP